MKTQFGTIVLDVGSLALRLFGIVAAEDDHSRPMLLSQAISLIRLLRLEDPQATILQDRAEHLARVRGVVDYENRVSQLRRTLEFSGQMCTSLCISSSPFAPAKVAYFVAYLLTIEVKKDIDLGVLCQNEFFQPLARFCEPRSLDGRRLKIKN